MANQTLSTVTSDLIESYGKTAKNVIDAYRVGNQRAIGFMDQRWASAVGKAGNRLSAEARGNAVAAQQKLTGYYAKGVALTTDSADSVVDKAVELAGLGLTQVAANAGRFEKATGVTALNTLAVAAVPAAQAVTKVAAKLEAQTGALASKIAGKKPKAKTAAKTAAKRAPAKKTAR